MIKKRPKQPEEVQKKINKLFFSPKYRGQWVVVEKKSGEVIAHGRDKEKTIIEARSLCKSGTLLFLYAQKLNAELSPE